jgi:hypothetical protein
MDILVTVPLSQVAHFWREDHPPGSEEEFWSLGRVPRDLRPGDFIWFQIRGRIVARARVCRIERHGEDLCALEGRAWSGCLAYWRIPDFERVLEGPGSALTRGFQYRPPLG